MLGIERPNPSFNQPVQGEGLLFQYFLACLSSDRRLLAVVVFKCKDLPVCCSADIPHYKIYLKILKERDNIQFLTPVSRVPSEAKKETQQVHTGKFYLT